MGGLCSAKERQHRLGLVQVDMRVPMPHMTLKIP